MIWSVVFIIGIYFTTQTNQKIEEKSYTHLVSAITKGEINEIEITYDKNLIIYKDKDKINKVNVPNLEVLMKDISKEVVEGKVNVKQLKKPVSAIALEVIFTLLPYILMLAVLVFWLFAILRKKAIRQEMGDFGKDMPFTKSKARLVDVEENPDITFKEVAGIEEEKEELKEIVDFLKNPAKYTEMGARIPKGVLLVGRPRNTEKHYLQKLLQERPKYHFI